MGQQRTSVKQKIKNGMRTYITCVFIALIIYVVVIIEDYYERVVIANPDLSFKLTVGLFTIFSFGFALFLLVSSSPQLHRLLFRMFGAEEESKGEQKQNQTPT
jgi:hypothetical protein